MLRKGGHQFTSRAPNSSSGLLDRRRPLLAGRNHSIGESDLFPILQDDPVALDLFDVFRNDSRYIEVLEQLIVWNGNLLGKVRLLDVADRDVTSQVSPRMHNCFS